MNYRDKSQLLSDAQLLDLVDNALIRVYKPTNSKLRIARRALIWLKLRRLVLDRMYWGTN